MKKILFLLLISANSFGQIWGSYSAIANLKNSAQLIPNTVYILSDLGKMQIVAKTNNSFYEKPFVRTIYAMDYDEELFYFDTKKIMGIDNISCVVRCQNATWCIISDAGHAPKKVSGVSDNMFLYFTKTYDKVIGFQTSIDETYAQSNLNISIGASVGFDKATILFFKSVIVNGQIQKQFATKTELSIEWSNIFISGELGKFIQL